MNLAVASWLHYVSARRNQRRCLSSRGAALWETEARICLDKHFAAVDVAAFTSDPKPWVWRHEADHRPIDKSRWRAKRRAQF